MIGLDCASISAVVTMGLEEVIGLVDEPIGFVNTMGFCELCIESFCLNKKCEQIERISVERIPYRDEQLIGKLGCLLHRHLVILHKRIQVRT